MHIPSFTNFESTFLSQAPLSVLAYGFCSVSMVLFNKALVSSFHYDSFVALILLQNIIGLCCLVLLRRNFDFVKFPLKLELRHIKIWFPANIFFLFMLVTGSGSLHGLPIQLVTVFKNTTNVIIAIGDWLFFGNVTSSMGAVSFILTMIATLYSA